MANRDAWYLHEGTAVEAGRTIVARLGGGMDHEVYAVDDHRFGRFTGLPGRRSEPAIG